MSERLLASLQSAIAELDDGDRDRLLTNLSHNCKGLRELSRDQMAVWEALRAASVGITPPIDRFLATYGRARYEERVAEILEFLRDTRRFLRQPQRDALLVECIRCLARHLEAVNARVSPASLLANLPSLAYAVDRAYPGYAAAGMLHHIVAAA